MTDIAQFDILKNWKLLKGSHQFPGPHGGTCINEAALVVAGFKYKSVSSVADLPSCFCPIISAFSIALNDHMPDSQRHRLIPFVTRLAGTKDTGEIQQQRLEWLVWQIIRIDVPNALTVIGLHDRAKKLMTAETFEEAARAAAAGAAEAARAAEAAAAWAAARAAEAAAAWAAGAAARVAVAGAAGAAEAARAAVAGAAVAGAAGAAEAARAAVAGAAAAAWAAEAGAAVPWARPIELLEGLLAIGKQAEPIETALITKRVREFIEKE